jgi:hypothetical protein
VHRQVQAQLRRSALRADYRHGQHTGEGAGSLPHGHAVESCGKGPVRTPGAMSTLARACNLAHNSGKKCEVCFIVKQFTVAAARVIRAGWRGILACAENLIFMADLLEESCDLTYVDPPFKFRWGDAGAARSGARPPVAGPGRSIGP